MISGMGDGSISKGVLVMTDNATIAGMSFIDGDQYGLRLESTDGPTISHSESYLSDYGLMLKDTVNVTVTTSRFRYNLMAGIWMDNATSTRIEECLISTNNVNGMVVIESSNLFVNGSKVYENTSPVQEVAYDQGILFLNVGDRFATAAYNIVKLKDRPFVEGVDPAGPFHGAGFKEGYAPEIKDKANPVSAILAIDPTTGKELWAIRDIANYTAGSLAIKGDYAVYQAANGLFCVHSRTGKRIWAKEKSIVNAVGHDSLTPGTTPNTVVITDEEVFAVESSRTKKIVANAKSTVFAYSLKDGINDGWIKL